MESISVSWDMLCSVEHREPVEHRQEELQDIQAEGGHSPPCWGRRVPDTAAAVASAAAEDAAAAAEGELLLLAVAAVQRLSL